MFMVMIEYLTVGLVIVIMMIIDLVVCFSPLVFTNYMGWESMDTLSRILGCLIAIPMIRLTFNVIDWVIDLKYWR